MKNALKLILSLVSVLVLVVLAAVYFWPTSDSGEFVSSPLDYISDKIVSDELTVESCEGLPDSDVCFLKLAKQSGDASFCKRIKGHNYYYACAEKIWESDGCVYAALVGDSLDACTFVPAVPSNYHDCRDEDDVHECEDFMFKRVIDSD
ncbi:hypothetical protein HN662_00065, partial [Candidatus Woesearchaeota archaeon]|nr:hypothetical protein [Candidatus Woesearchaeota archaeon]